MIKNSILYIIIALFLFSCEAQERKMDIRYFTLNDYDTNYVFDIENNLEALKKMHSYALNEIKEQKHAVDSLKASSYIDSLPKTYEEHQYGTSLSLSPSDVYLYTPPGEFSFDQVDDKDLVLLYELDEESFIIENIVVGNKYTSSSYTIEEAKNGMQSSLQINTDEFTLEVLSQLLGEIKKIGHHYQEDIYTYQIKDVNNKHVLDIIYKDKGTSLLLNYK